MAAKKKPGRKAPARKVAAVHREREGKQKRKREPAHVLEDVRPVQPEFDFRAKGDGSLADLVTAAKGEPANPHNLFPPDEIAGWPKGSPQYDSIMGTHFCPAVAQESPEPGPVLKDKGRSVVPQEYKDAYGPEGNCGDMVALILSYRTLEDLEVYVYEKEGKAWPGVNAGMRRMNAGNIIRRLVRQNDNETLAWLVATSTR